MIDLHTHTTYSDGSFSVQELFEEAERVGLTLLSITDHNTIQAYQEIKDSNSDTIVAVPSLKDKTVAEARQI